MFQAGLRSACGLPLVLLFAVVTHKRLSLRDGSLLPGLVAGLLFGTEFMLVFQAVELTTVSRVVVLFYTMPIWVAIGAHFFIPGEGLTRIRTMGLVLAVTGVVVAMGNRPGGVGADALVGDVMCLVAAMCWAAITIITRTTGLKNATPEMQLLYQLAVSSVLLIGTAPLFGDLVLALTPTILLIFALQVLMVVLIGFLCWFWLLSRYPASDVASYGFLVPVFGVFFSWLILDEAISVNLLVALVLVGAGIVLVNRR